MSQRPISLDLFHQNKVWRGASPVPSIPKEWYAGLPQSNTLFIWPQASVLPFRGLPAQKGGSFPGSLEKERRVLGFFCAPKLPCGSHGIRAVLINTRVIVLCSCSKACCLARRLPAFKVKGRVPVRTSAHLEEGIPLRPLSRELL
ncbi:hypothetical protein Q3G72_031328 [Acer saccharum]|nr:hypothetical protein Q3G72_031328 [Acer saccharum]